MTSDPLTYLWPPQCRSPRSLATSRRASSEVASTQLLEEKKGKLGEMRNERDEWRMNRNNDGEMYGKFEKAQN